MIALCGYLNNFDILIGLRINKNMKTNEIILSEREGDDDIRDDWSDATKKYHSKKRSSGRKETRMWLAPATKKRLQSLKDKYKVEDIGAVVDKLVK